MARRVYKYQQFNETPDKPLGILLPFNKNAGGAKSVNAHYSASAASGKGVFQSSYSVQEQAMSNLKNLLLTQKGERVFQPNFGTDIQKSLFENNTVDLELSLEADLRSDIEFWLPYIDINSIDIVRRVDDHSFFINLNFSINEVGANEEIIIFVTPTNISISEGSVSEVQVASQPSITNFAGGY